MNRTKIQWAPTVLSDGTVVDGYSSNPIRALYACTGASKYGHACVKVSAGCANCYAERWNRRFGTGLDFRRLDSVQMVVDQREMGRIARRKQRCSIFLCDMTDLFQDAVTDRQIETVWNMMAACPQHIFKILTKRPNRMRDFVSGTQPLPNVWLGTSVETQGVTYGRLSDLLNTPAAYRFISVEPLLMWVKLNLADYIATGPIHQVIVGGESGQKARPMNPEWARAIRDECAALGIPFFMKQMGTHWAREHGCGDFHGGEPWTFPGDLRIRQWPEGVV